MLEVQGCRKSGQSPVCDLKVRPGSGLWPERSTRQLLICSYNYSFIVAIIAFIHSLTAQIRAIAMNTASGACCSSCVSPTNPDLWVYNTDELIRYPQRRKQSSVVWSHFKVHKFHEAIEKSGYEGFADKAWCDYCHKPFVKENSTLLRHQQRHYKKELRESSGEQEEASLTLAYKGRESTLITKKGNILQPSLYPSQIMSMILQCNFWHRHGTIIYSLLFLQTVCLLISSLLAYQEGR